MKFEKNTFVFVGGAGGIGFSFAQLLFATGAEKIAIFDLTDPRNTIQQLNSEFPTKTVLFYKVDVRSKVDIENAFSETIRQFGHVDVMINGAGIINESNIEDTLHINLFGVIYGTQVALDHMSIEKGGSGGMIVNIASKCGFDSSFNIPAYVASKHGVLGYTRALADDVYYRKFGVKFVTICPGVTQTNLVANLDNLVYDKDLVEETKQRSKDRGIQTVEACTKSMLHALKHSENGSIWKLDKSECKLINMHEY